MSRLIPVAAAVLLMVSGTSVLAQSRPMVDVAAGLAGGKGRASGVAAQVAFEFYPTSRVPVSVRADLSLHQWRDGFLNSHNTARGTAGTLDLVYRMPTTHVRPYVLTGVGAYAVQGLGFKPGWNVGGGLEVPLGRYSVFGEVRGHFLRTDMQDRLTPIVLGVRF